MLSPVASEPYARQQRALALEHWFELPEWEPAPPAAGPLRRDELDPCLILGGGAVARALAERLRGAGCETVLVERGSAFALRGPAALPDGGWGAAATVDPESAEDHVELLRWSAQRGRRPRRIVVAWTLGAAACGRIDRALSRALHPVLALAQAIARDHDRRPLAVDILTAGAHDVDGSEPTDPALATVLGPTRVIPLELPHVSVRHVDVRPELHHAEAEIEALAAELAAEPAPPVVALRGQVRWLPSLRPLELPAPADGQPWRRGGSYLITGGLGAFGLALAEHLARSAQARVALVSRTALPPRQVWDELLSDPDDDPRLASVLAAIGRIEAAGGAVAVHAADVADREAMSRVRREVLAQFGRLDGIVHAAGVAAGGLVESRPRHDIERVLAPKVEGTLVLAQVFADQALDFYVLCSSLTSFVGGVGHVDYCAANAFLDAFPRSEWPLADRAVTVNWGGLLGSSMWIPREDDVGMELSDAVRALERALAANVGPRISIAPVHVEDARPWLPSRAEQGGGTGSGAPPERSLAELEARLAELWAEALELDEVPLDGDFFELGGNSLLGIELLWRLADELGFRLPMQLLVEAATPAAVARAIEARLGAAASS